MNTLLSLIGILLTIFFVIGTHESAHFMTARLLGVKVLRFSIGFGKSLLSWHDKKGTEYVIALIPLGGYVKMLDETEGEVPLNELSFAYNRQPLYKKALIVLAGPAANIFCAFVLYWLIFTNGFVTIKPVIGSVTPQSIAAEAGLHANQEIISLDNKPTPSWTTIFFRLMTHIGNKDHIQIETTNILDKTVKKDNKIHSYRLNLINWHMNDLNPDPLTSLGLTPYEPVIPLIIGTIVPTSPAAQSPLKIGDKILALNEVNVNNWEEIITMIDKHPDTLMTITITRQGETLKIPVRIGFKRDLLFQKHGLLGISPQFHWPKELLHTIQYGLIAAISPAWQEVTDLTYFNLILFEKMFTGKLSLQSLGGPITIFETAGDAFNSGFIAFISFLAFLSISIGVINLLPIPGLDGGHLLIQIIESIIRRPIPEYYLLLLFRLGFIFIFFILIHALTNDILRLY